MVFKHEFYRGENTTSHSLQFEAQVAWTHTQIVVSGAQLEHLPNADTPLFWHFHCITLQCFLRELKLST